MYELRICPSCEKIIEGYRDFVAEIDIEKLFDHVIKENTEENISYAIKQVGALRYEILKSEGKRPAKQWWYVLKELDDGNSFSVEVHGYVAELHLSTFTEGERTVHMQRRQWKKGVD